MHKLVRVFTVIPLLTVGCSAADTTTQATPAAFSITSRQHYAADSEITQAQRDAYAVVVGGLSIKDYYNIILQTADTASFKLDGQDFSSPARLLATRATAYDKLAEQYATMGDYWQIRAFLRQNRAAVAPMLAKALTTVGRAKGDFKFGLIIDDTGRRVVEVSVVFSERQTILLPPVAKTLAAVVAALRVDGREAELRRDDADRSVAYIHTVLGQDQSAASCRHSRRHDWRCRV